MLIEYEDFNNAYELFQEKYCNEWTEIEKVLTAMPLYMTSSQQKDKKEKPNFDPKATNDHIEKELNKLGWTSKLPIPKEFSAFGVHVDIAKRGLLLEIQFSNYPYFLNNVVRSELLFKSCESIIEQEPVELLLIITKSNVLPSSNSTLYYEQAIQQRRELTKYDMLNVLPIRIVGLTERAGNYVDACWTEYEGENQRSRSVKKQSKFSYYIPSLQSSRSPVSD